MKCETCGVIFMSMSELRRHADCEEHRHQMFHDFSCLSCSLTLHTIPDVIEHVDGAEHYILNLASNNPFDTLEENFDEHGESFPPLYFCMLCSCRDGEPYGVHLESAIHKNTVRLIKTIFCNRAIHYTNDFKKKYRFDNLENSNRPVHCKLCNMWFSNWYNYKIHLSSIIHVKTQGLISKLINVNRYPRSAHTCDDFCYSFSFACGLCNIHFNSHESYEYHLENKTHKRVELFLFEMSNMLKDLGVIIRAFDLENSETFCNSLPALYYCDLCERFSFESSGYVQHSKSFVHKRIEELFEKLSDKRNGKVIRLCLTEQDSAELSTHYCKLCMVGFSDASDYGLHLNDKEHSKIENFIMSLIVESEVNFINNYIDAQIQMMSGDSPPPNYCDLCNILLFESEKYEQHLATDEHKQAENQQFKNIHSINESASKQLKKSSFLNNEELDNVQDNTVINKSDSCQVDDRHQDTKPLLNEPEFGFETHQTNIGYPPLTGFANHEVNYYPTLFKPQISASRNYPFSGYNRDGPYVSYPILPCFKAPEPYDYYPLPNFMSNNKCSPCSRFQAGEINNHHPPWTGFQAPAYATLSNNPPWPGFHSHVNATIRHNPPWYGFETYIKTPKLEFKNSESDSICPPGTEGEERNVIPSQQDLEDGSAQIGLEPSEEATSNFSEDKHCCELCNYTCSNSQLYEEHLKSEKHKLWKQINIKYEKSLPQDTQNF